MNNLLTTFAGVMSTIGAVVLAIVILLIMISIHEFGHYIAGKILKFKITEFSIGMGPALFKKKNEKTGELFAIRAVPLGGYCSFYGEDEDKTKTEDMTEEEVVNAEGAFNNKEPWKRIIVLVAGATMNFILGIIFLMLSIGIYGQRVVSIGEINEKVAVDSVLQEEDVLLSVDGKNIYMTTDIVSILEDKKKGDEITLVVLRDGEEKKLTMNLYSDPAGENLTDLIGSYSALGVGTVVELGEVTRDYFKTGDVVARIVDAEEREDCTRIYTLDELASLIRTYKKDEVCSLWIIRDDTYQQLDITIDFNPEDLESDRDLLERMGITESTLYLSGETITVKFGFFETIKRGFAYSVDVAGTVFRILGQLLTGKLGLNTMGGTVTTIVTTTTMIKTGGLQYFFELGGYIGVNLAVVNLLPIPALDGCRVIFNIIEWIRKKPVNRKVEAIIHTVGLVALLIFSVAVDLLHLF